MYQQNDTQVDEITTELQAIVDLTDANVSPITEAGTWEEEIAAWRHGERESAQLSTSDEIREVIDQADALA